ncbi:MAG: SMC-Scp complex subunit ScpB [Candidatus Woesearchaeota archaeon]
MKRKEIKNRIEALLFITGKPLSLNRISKTIGIKTEYCEEILKEMLDELEKRDGALFLFEEDNEWHMSIREKYSGLIKDLVSELQMDQSVLQTLSVIAWKAPVLQSEVIDIRNNKAYNHIDILHSKGFVTKNSSGRTYILRLTDKFYDYFEVESKEELKEKLESSTE